MVISSWLIEPGSPGITPLSLPTWTGNLQSNGFLNRMARFTLFQKTPSINPYRSPTPPIFSSNYSLYADMSARVMKVVSQFSPRLEVYSIDEAFLDLSEQNIDDLLEFGRTIKARVLQFTGIPVSVGIASTKCLTKVANEIVKREARYEGVLDCTALSEQAMDEVLAKVAIEDVWGI